MLIEVSYSLINLCLELFLLLRLVLIFAVLLLKVKQLVHCFLEWGKIVFQQGCFSLDLLELLLPRFCL